MVGLEDRRTNLLQLQIFSLDCRNALKTNELFFYLNDDGAALYIKIENIIHRFGPKQRLHNLCLYTEDL